jgi:hypothetical protein
MINHRHGGRDLVRRFAGLIAAILIGAVLLLWAWNTVATELLGAPQAGFRHGLAFAAAVAGVAVLIAIAKSLAGAGFSRHGGGDQAR